MRTLLVVALVAILAAGAGGCTGCQTAAAEGVLTPEGNTLVLRPPTGDTIRVAWPAGYGVRHDGGQTVLVDWLGSVKAREGDHVRVGGASGTDDRFHACGPIDVDAP
jgi:hypothetical protein